MSARRRSRSSLAPGALPRARRSPDVVPVSADHRVQLDRGQIGLDRDALGRRQLLLVESEVRGEPAPGDLAGRPPERLLRRARGVTRGPAHIRAQVVGRRSSQKQPSQNRAEGARLDVGARSCRDCLRGGVGLLGRDAALLDRAGGCISGGVDVRLPLDRAVRVRPDEPLAVARQSWKGRAPQAGRLITRSAGRDSSGTRPASAP